MLVSIGSGAMAVDSSVSASASTTGYSTAATASTANSSIVGLWIGLMGTGTSLGAAATTSMISSSTSSIFTASTSASTSTSAPTPTTLSPSGTALVLVFESALSSTSPAVAESTGRAVTRPLVSVVITNPLSSMYRAETVFRSFFILPLATACAAAAAFRSCSSLFCRARWTASDASFASLAAVALILVAIAASFSFCCCFFCFCCCCRIFSSSLSLVSRAF
mmetsp:Transcript_17506/g.26483  ORF Transcript_17506/g.26483 Transcript_17506/m.26483 type:complete len:222 (-) Transcript_17506:912-1577(-)